MSATNRGAQRHPDDFYATPAWATRAILPCLPSGGALLDPCAGEGAILDVVAAACAGEPRFGWRPAAFEIDADRAQTCLAKGFDGPGGGRSVERDALAPPSWGSPAVVLTNPPYGLAMAFVERALAEVRPGGVVAMLLRLNWLASQKRAAFHRERPADVFVLPKRPSFGLNKNGKPGTDATEYAWFAWGLSGGRWCVLEVPR